MMELLENIPMKVYAISELVGNKDIGIIVLADHNAARHIAVICDKACMQQLKLRLEKNKSCGFMLPETLSRIIDQQYGIDYSLLIDDITDGTYQARIVGDGLIDDFCLRATDAVLLHLISKKPLYATAELMNNQSTPLIPGNPAMALPYNALSDNMLFDAMKSAVEQEKYEMASSIRDELRKRGKI